MTGLDSYCARQQILVSRHYLLNLSESVQNFALTRLNLPFQSGTGRIVVTQVVATAIGTFLCAFFGLVAFYSALLGGLACILPNTYAIWRVFGRNRGVHPSDPRVFGIMLRVEIVKIAITGFVFAGIFWLISPINPIAMFAVFTVVTFAGWIEAGLRIR